MSQRTASFLIRIEAGGLAGTVTSVQSGEHAAFDGVAELGRILERWADDDGARTSEEKP